MTFLEAFVTLLVVMDPIGNVPVFLVLTEEEAERRARAARQATATAGAVILVFAALGEQLLQVLGISLEALQVSGGLLLALVALQLLSAKQETITTPEGRNVALVPLGTPLLAGPGAIAVTMVHIRDANSFGDVVAVCGAVVVALLVVYVVLRMSIRVFNAFGPNAIHLVSQIVGLLLAAIAAQLVATGIDHWVREGV